MEAISYILWAIVAPFVITFLGAKIFKIRTWIIVSFETLVVLLLTFVDIIENNPMGSLQGQLSSYFGNITNNFYLKYIPLIIVTIIFMQFLKKQSNRKISLKH
jgi:hypothetical protein